MKKIFLIFLLMSMMLMVGCGRDQSLLNVVYGVNLDNLSEDELMLLDQGTYSESFVLVNTEELSTWIEENGDNVSNLLVEDLANYDQSYFEDNLLVIAYVTYRAYSVDFSIQNQVYENNVLNLEIQYHVPWYAFGDSWSEAYALLIELPKGEPGEVTVEISYVER